MMHRRTGGWAVLLLLMAGALLAGCRAPGELSRDEAATFAGEVAPSTERLLQALSDGDEATFTAEMTDQMRQASSGERFDRMREQIWGVLGDYESAEMRQVLQQNEFWNVVYRANFAEEQGVVVRVVYADVDGTRLVSGLWFDSLKLRAAR